VKTNILVVAILAILAFGGTAFAAGESPGVIPSGGSLVTLSDPSGTVVGWEFTVTLPLCFSALGYYDSGLDGLSESHQVGLFDSSGTLITSATVGTSDPLVGGFRYASIPAFCATVGETYILGAYTSSGSADLLLQDPSVSVHPGIDFVGGRIENDSPFGFPTQSTSTTYFGANVQILDDCLPGTVNDAIGFVKDVLFVNGSGGADAQRKVAVAAGDLIWCVLLNAPAGGNGKFVMHANAGAPTDATVTPLPGGVGIGCFPFLLAAGGNPLAVWNNIGKTDLVGSSQYFDGSPIPDPARAPVVFLQLSQGDVVNLPVGTTVTFQGIIVDLGSSSQKSASTTNGVILNVF
jgi:hypothetical protein